MGSFITKAKRFISNKNTVTIIWVILGVLVLYIGYNYRVQSALNPTRVPYAKVPLEARHVIEPEDIGFIEVNSDVISRATNLITNQNDLIGMKLLMEILYLRMVYSMEEMLPIQLYLQIMF